jgi:hypothetical protein
MQDVFIVAIIFGTAALIVKMAIDHNLRLKVLAKSQAGVPATPLEIHLSENSNSSLKWGLVLTLVGTALLVMEIIPTEVRDEVVLSVMLIAAGAGFLIYHGIGDLRARKRKALQAM